VLVDHSYDGLYTQMYAARYSDDVALSRWAGDVQTDQESAPDPNPSPRLGCVRCESALLAGGLPLLRALLMAAAGGSTRPRGLPS
jgi:hypothetical protein